jgi:transposase
VLVSKYCDHTLLYRQTQNLRAPRGRIGTIHARRWVSGACWWLEALHERLCKDMFASDHLFADDTPVLSQGVKTEMG